MRAVTFQSMVRTSSPGRYSRTSLNSMPRAAEDAVVLAEEEHAHKAAGADLQAADACQHLLGRQVRRKFGGGYGHLPRVGRRRRGFRIAGRGGAFVNAGARATR